MDNGPGGPDEPVYVPDDDETSFYLRELAKGYNSLEEEDLSANEDDDIVHSDYRTSSTSGFDYRLSDVGTD